MDVRNFSNSSSNTLQHLSNKQYNELEKQVANIREERDRLKMRMMKADYTNNIINRQQREIEQLQS